MTSTHTFPKHEGEELQELLTNLEVFYPGWQTVVRHWDEQNWIMLTFTGDPPDEETEDIIGAFPQVQVPYFASGEPPYSLTFMVVPQYVHDTVMYAHMDHHSTLMPITPDRDAGTEMPSDTEILEYLADCYELAPGQDPAAEATRPDGPHLRLLQALTTVVTRQGWEGLEEIAETIADLTHATHGDGEHLAGVYIDTFHQWAIAIDAAHQ